jgi:V-type H+-transporting ATPase subunit H
VLHFEGPCKFFTYGSTAEVAHVGIPTLSKAILEHPDPYKPMLPFLTQSSNPEDPIPLLASTVLASLMAASATTSPKGTPATNKSLPKLLSYLSTLAQSPDGGLQDIAVLEYSALLRGKKSRQLFWEQRSETVGPLVGILKSAAGVSPNGDSSSTLWSGASSIRSGMEGSLSGGVGLQLLYHVLLVMWQLSFEGATVGDGLEEYMILLGRDLE